MVYILLGTGFEEIEALTPVDCLRRAGKTVCTVGIGGTVIKGSHGVPVTADIADSALVLDDSVEMIVLPGGMPGTANLDENTRVRELISFCADNDKYIFAICAAPSVLGHMGLLQGRKATCYPGFETELTGAVYCDAPAVQDAKIITGKGYHDVKIKLEGEGFSYMDHMEGLE